MNKVGQFLNTRWGAVVLWVVVMYVTAGLWSIIDDGSWYAFPSYVVIVLAWIGSFLFMLAAFIEWSDGKVQLKRAAPNAPQHAQSPGSDRYED